MDSKLITLFPFIENSVKRFDSQNRFLKMIVLTGKICALEKATNLFSFTEKTIDTFQELKEELIPLLIQENIKKYTDEIHSKAQTSIDILIRNLFERTADVGFLATDTQIISFLNHELSAENLRERLIEYTLKYSVYDEIIITDTKGQIELSMSGSLCGITTVDPIVDQALRTDGYVEQYAKSDLAPSLPKALLFAQKITENSKNIGVLILRFRFTDEMQRIFSSLLKSSENIFFTDGNSIITSSTQDVTSLKHSISTVDKEYLLDKNYLYTPASTKGYEGYFGAPWTSIAYVDIYKATQSGPVVTKRDAKCSLDQNIKAIIAKADDVIEDLSDVIINGELIASREKVYVLTPVLDNLRIVSSSILETIKETVENLENTIMDSLIYEAKASASLAIEIMDRNLYERANDCRWWAMTPIFEEELSQKEPNSERVSEVLCYINGLYTVYTNLFVYNKLGTVIASSQDASIVGKKVVGEFVTKTLNNSNSQYYFVSPFEKTTFYADKATYIYNATIRNDNKTCGGIGIVFDSLPQFNAILNDSFPVGKKGFSCFVDPKGVIIATTHSALEPMTRLDICDEILQFNGSEAMYKFIDFMDKKYLVGVAYSKGYREYKCHDNYKNELLSLTFLEY